MHPSEPFGDQTSIREILRRWPHTRDVFERAGLMGCGGPEGPDESLEFFANVHHVALGPLKESLADAIATGPRAVRSLPVAPAAPLAFEPVHRYVPFLLAAVVVALTLGATLGAFNLARMTTAWFGGMTLGSVRAHAVAQVFGFVGLFVMGVACHVLPRFAARPLAAAPLVRGILLLQVTGVSAIAVAFMAADSPLRTIWIAGAVALVAAAAMFVVVVSRTVAGLQGPERFARWVIAGAAWQLASAGVLLAAGWLDDVAVLQAIWPAALWGFAVSWIFGIGRRILPGFLGWRPRAARAESSAFVLYQVAVACSVAAAWPAALEHPAAIWTGAIGLLAAVPLFSWCLGVGTPRSLRRDVEDGYQRFITTAWLWLLVALAVGPAWTLVAALRGGVVPPLVTDFARHALAFGFVTQVIVGVATRILPVFTGNALWSRGARTATYYLLNASVVMRSLEAFIALGFVPGAWPYLSIAAVPALAAMALFAGTVVFTIYGRPAAEGQNVRPAALADRRILDVLRIGGALEVLVDAGFTPLTNPVMRATFAGAVTLRQACSLRGVPLEPIVARLEALEPKRTIITLIPQA